MSINNAEVKLFESQRLTDEEDGDGRVTGSEIIDSNVNNLYRDISRIDRTVSDVALRKAFAGISTDNNDAYPGSHIILTEAPADETSASSCLTPVARLMYARQNNTSG